MRDENEERSRGTCLGRIAGRRLVDLVCSAAHRCCSSRMSSWEKSEHLDDPRTLARNESSSPLC